MAVFRDVPNENNALLVVLGDQLFDPSRLVQAGYADLPLAQRPTVYMAESHALCTVFKYHQIKLSLVLSGMRHYAAELEEHGWRVHYEALVADGPDPDYFDKLDRYRTAHNIKSLHHCIINDRFFAAEINAYCQKHQLQRKEVPLTSFVTTREAFDDYLARHRNKPFMATFYQEQRKRLGIMVSNTHQPQGGKWSFDADNRKALPKSVELPRPPGALKHDATDKAVIELVKKRFPTHPGDAAQLWVPTTRKGARSWLRRFLSERLGKFGDYEDALSHRSIMLFHSVLTPFLNTGLLTANEVIDAVLSYDASRNAEGDPVPINSLEGFVRQIIGWREYIKGVDVTFGEVQHRSNFWQHHRTFKTDAWYAGTTGIRPLDDVINKVRTHAYAHHIERLMVVGNLMMLCEIKPTLAYQWYMEMFIDSAEWVMGPNVFGMILNADGGIAFTKPYVCGSNYLRKQADGCYKKSEPWCDVVDGLYWRFIEKHAVHLTQNRRMGLIVKQVEHMEKGKKERIFAAAEAFLDTFTELPKNFDAVAAKRLLYKAA